jgi:hypothetical protein
MPVFPSAAVMPESRDDGASRRSAMTSPPPLAVGAEECFFTITESGDLCRRVGVIMRQLPAMMKKSCFFREPPAWSLRISM